jgi:hypothetical protein
MRKMVLSTVGALMLLLAALLTWNSHAAAYSGILSIGPIYSSVQKVDCDAADQICEKDKHLVCSRGDDGKLDCQCEDCGAHPICPKSALICCAPGQCCTCGTGSFKCCPR